MLRAALQVGQDLHVNRFAELRRFDTLAILATDWMRPYGTSNLLRALSNISNAGALIAPDLVGGAGILIQGMRYEVDLVQDIVCCI